MKHSKLVLIVILLSLLTACGVAEFFIKRTVNGLEEKVVDEFNSYADFSDDQKRQIELFAQDIAYWVRANRLPILVQNLERTALDIEQNAALSEATWRQFVLFMEDPMELSLDPNTIYRLADLAYGLSTEQTQSVLAKLNDDFAESLEEMQQQTVDEQHDKILKGTKNIFKEIGIKRNAQQLKQARLMLHQRHAYLDQDIESRMQNQANFTNLIENRDTDLAAYRARFLAQWKVAERSPVEEMPDVWEHNFRVTHGMMNYLLGDISPQQKRDAAQSIRDYAALFSELSTGQSVAGLQTRSAH